MKWLLQNVRRRAKFAIKNPRYALSAMVRELTFADEKFLSAITGASASEIRGYLDEPIGTAEFAAHLRSAEEQFRKLAVDSADLFAKKILNQYAAVRALKPSCVVETGIANGVSSSYLLLALQKNGRGRLHSVGLADPAFLPAGKEPGGLSRNGCAAGGRYTWATRAIFCPACWGNSEAPTFSSTTACTRTNT